MRSIALVILLLVLAGCASNAPSATIPSAPSSAPASFVKMIAPTFLTPVSLGPAGRNAEPNLAVTPAGQVYATGFVQIWRSLDGGKSFEAVGKDACRFAGAPTCPPGASWKDAGLDGPGDGDFAADANGTLYWAGLVGKKASLPFQISRDHGDTWTDPVDLANGNSTDREWIDSTPNGTLYLTWRDFGSPKDSNPPADLVFRASTDAGAHWGPIRVIAPDALQGPIVHDARGAVYTPFYDHGIRLARSSDLGVTWTIVNVTSEDRDFSLRNGNPIDIFPLAAVDDAGGLYVVWSEDDATMAPAGSKVASVPAIMFTTSRDEGRTWSAPKVISTPGRAAVLPWIVAGANGRFAAAWYENAHGTPNEATPDQWNVMLVESGDAGATLVGGAVTPQPIHVGSVCTNGGGCRQECAAITCVPTGSCVAGLVCAGQDRSRSDFFEMALTPQRQPVLVWTADGAAPQNPGVEIQFGGVASGTPLR